MAIAAQCSLKLEGLEGLVLLTISTAALAVATATLAAAAEAAAATAIACLCSASKTTGILDDSSTTALLILFSSHC